MERLLYYKTSSTKPAVEFITKQLEQKLSKGRVLWLLSGGSAISLEEKAAQNLKGSLGELAVALVDERYGPAGHQDSNWQKLIQGGFKLPRAQLQPLLDNSDFNQTRARFNTQIVNGFRHSAYKIAVLGVGIDGHIAGIKPNSQAISAKGLTVGYSWDDFNRLTITFEALRQLDTAIVYMAGIDKHPVI